jgi:hypothetical protein
VTTDSNTGALLSTPLVALGERPPTPALDFDGLLESILSAPINFGAHGIMSLRSALGNALARLLSAEAKVQDISGNRIPAVLNEVVNNASLDAARELAQQLKDASQDASAAQAALEASTATADIAAAVVRVGALEAGAADALTHIGTLQSAVAGKADTAALDQLVARVGVAEADIAGKAAASDLSALDTRVGAAESSISALSDALPSKLAVADFQVYTAATDGAVAAAAAAASAAQSAAEAREFKGLNTQLQVAEVNMTGVAEAYFYGSVEGHINAGKLISIKSDAGQHYSIAWGAKYPNALVRIKNDNAAHTFTVAFDSDITVEYAAGETLSVVYTGAVWKLV